MIIPDLQQRKHCYRHELDIFTAPQIGKEKQNSLKERSEDQGSCTKCGGKGRGPGSSEVNAPKGKRQERKEPGHNAGDAEVSDSSCNCLSLEEIHSIKEREKKAEGIKGSKR